MYIYIFAYISHQKTIIYLNPLIMSNNFSIDVKILTELSNARTRAILDGKDNFEFMGKMFDVKYAKYLIEHIQNKLLYNKYSNN